MIMRKFFKKKEKQQLPEDPIRYINARKDHRFFFFTSWNGKRKVSPKLARGLRIGCLIALPVAAIGLGTALGILANQKNRNADPLTNRVELDTNVVHRRIYLLSEDNYTVPLTVALDKKSNVHEEMLDVINLLKVSSRAGNEYLHGFLPDDCKVNSFSTDDKKNLTIDFSAEFLNQTGIDETKMYEALCASMIQFDQVDSVSLSVDGQSLTSLPKSNFKLDGTVPYVNRIVSGPSTLENKELVTVFYQRTYDQKHSYLVPVSLYVDQGKSDNITFVNGLFRQLPSARQLKNLSLYEAIAKNQDEKENFSLKVTTGALIDEATVNKDLYEIVLLSLDLMGKEEKVSFEIEGETLAVEGIYQEEDVAVGSIYYNEVQL